MRKSFGELRTGGLMVCGAGGMTQEGTELKVGRYEGEVRVARESGPG
jgi:hypothetical protein